MLFTIYDLLTVRAVLSPTVKRYCWYHLTAYFTECLRMRKKPSLMSVGTVISYPFLVSPLILRVLADNLFPMLAVVSFLVVIVICQ